MMLREEVFRVTSVTSCRCVPGVHAVPEGVVSVMSRVGRDEGNVGITV